MRLKYLLVLALLLKLSNCNPSVTDKINKLFESFNNKLELIQRNNDIDESEKVQFASIIYDVYKTNLKILQIKRVTEQLKIENAKILDDKKKEQQHEFENFIIKKYLMMKNHESFLNDFQNIRY